MTTANPRGQAACDTGLIASVPVQEPSRPQELFYNVYKSHHQQCPGQERTHVNVGSKTFLAAPN